MVGGGGKNWGKLCLWILKDTIPQKLYVFLKGKQKSCLFKKNTYISLNDHEGQQHITKQSGKKNTGARIHLKLLLKRPRIHKSTRKHKPTCINQSQSWERLVLKGSTESTNKNDHRSVYYSPSAVSSAQFTTWYFLFPDCSPEYRTINQSSPGLVFQEDDLSASRTRKKSPLKSSFKKILKTMSSRESA